MLIILDIHNLILITNIYPGDKAGVYSRVPRPALKKLELPPHHLSYASHKALPK